MVHPKNLTRWKSLDKVAADPRVEEVRDEGADGIWVDLVRGWNSDGASSVHGFSVKDVLAEWRRIAEGDSW